MTIMPTHTSSIFTSVPERQKEKQWFITDGDQIVQPVLHKHGISVSQVWLDLDFTWYQQAYLFKVYLQILPVIWKTIINDRLWVNGLKVKARRHLLCPLLPPALPPPRPRPPLVRNSLINMNSFLQLFVYKLLLKQGPQEEMTFIQTPFKALNGLATFLSAAYTQRSKQ